MDIRDILKNYIETCKTTGIKVIDGIIDKINDGYDDKTISLMYNTSHEKIESIKKMLETYGSNSKQFLNKVYNEYYQFINNQKIGGAGSSLEGAWESGRSYNEEQKREQELEREREEQELRRREDELRRRKEEFARRHGTYDTSREKHRYPQEFEAPPPYSEEDPRRKRKSTSTSPSIAGFNAEDFAALMTEVVKKQINKEMAGVKRDIEDTNDEEKREFKKEIKEEENQMLTFFKAALSQVAAVVTEKAVDAVAKKISSSSH